MSSNFEHRVTTLEQLFAGREGSTGEPIDPTDLARRLAFILGGLIRPPSIIAPIGLLWGYLSAWLSRVDRLDDPELLHYVRQQQLNRLLGRESL